MVCLDQTQQDADSTSHQSQILCVVQAIALSRKQMADRGIRQAVDSVCAQAPARPHHQPPLHAAPTSSSRQRHAMPSTSERRASAMPSTAGRPLHLPSSSPSRPFSSTAHCHQADGATQMPAWAQKAKQAGVVATQADSRHANLPWLRRQALYCACKKFVMRLQCHKRLQHHRLCKLLQKCTMT